MQVSHVPIRADNIPGSLAEAIQSLPEFKMYTDGWVEPDPAKYPLVAEVLAGEVGDVEVSVGKLWSGSTQLTFAFYVDAEDEFEVDEDSDGIICGLAWLFPSIESVLATEDGPVFYTGFSACGDLSAILDNELLLSVIRLTDQILNRLLFGDPREFMAMNAAYAPGEGVSLPSIEDEEEVGNAFVRELIFMIGAAEPYFAE